MDKTAIAFARIFNTRFQEYLSKNKAILFLLIMLSGSFLIWHYREMNELQLEHRSALQDIANIKKTLSDDRAEYGTKLDLMMIELKMIEHRLKEEQSAPVTKKKKR